jgi:hypothetical protein
VGAGYIGIPGLERQRGKAAIRDDQANVGSPGG